MRVFLSEQENYLAVRCTGQQTPSYHGSIYHRRINESLFALALVEPTQYVTHEVNITDTCYVNRYVFVLARNRPDEQGADDAAEHSTHNHGGCRWHPVGLVSSSGILHINSRSPAPVGALVRGFIYLRLFSQDRMAPKPSMPIISSHRLSSMTDAGTFTSGII